MEACRLRTIVRILIASLVIVCAARRADADTYEVLHAFGRTGGIPSGSLVLQPDGSLLGVGSNAGFAGAGVVFLLTPDGGGGYTYSVLHTFLERDGNKPLSGLAADGRGFFYGATYQGGAHSDGVVFQIDASGRQSVLHDFLEIPDGRNPNAPLLRAADGSFWGTTYAGGDNGNGTVFRIDSSGALSKMHSFKVSVDGMASPNCRLMQSADGSVYGTTLFSASNAGAIYRIDGAGQFTIVHAFSGTDGLSPNAGLTAGMDGKLYGTTAYGGPTGNGGVAFRMDPSGDNFEVIHEFTFGEGAQPETTLIPASGGGFYGTLSIGGSGGTGVIFHLDASGTMAPIHELAADGHEGFTPAVELVEAPDGSLFGGTIAGGPATLGTIFRIDPQGTLTTLYAFEEPVPDHPWGGLIAATDGKLYGTTTYAPPATGGGIYSLGTSGSISVLRALDASEGTSIQGGLLQALDGALYGMAVDGGTADQGTLFKISTAGEFQLLHTFAIPEQGNPEGGFTNGGDGFLYGGQMGFTSPAGAVFKMDQDGALTTLHVFSGPDGSTPVTPPVFRSGILYGTTPAGGTPGPFGTLYRIDDAGFHSFYSFAGQPGGSNPNPILLASDGNLYGTTLSGGLHNDGTVFRVDASDTVTTFHDFQSAVDGELPVTLTQAADGNLYGTTAHGGIDGLSGTVFRLKLDGTLDVLHPFSGLDGSGAHGTPLLAPDGALYGTTQFGGLYGSGVIYRIIFGIDGLTPILTNGVLPHSGRAAGGTSVTIEGAGFAFDATVTIGDVPGIAVSGIDSYTLRFIMPPLPPASLPLITIANPGGGTMTLTGFWFADFLDVDSVHPFHDFVESIFRAQITAGCRTGYFCPDDVVTREQMAVFLLKSEHGSSFAPPPCTGVFADVACTPGVGFPDWIEQLYAEQITGGCSLAPLQYCPGRTVTRAEMAVFLLKTRHGTGYVPDSCAGIFADVPCPATPEFPFSDWIEQLYADAITGGCAVGPLRYCPDNPNTRGEMAVFLTKTFLP